MRPPVESGVSIPGRSWPGFDRSSFHGDGGILIERFHPALNRCSGYRVPLHCGNRRGELYLCGRVDFVEITPEALCRQRGSVIEIVAGQSRTGARKHAPAFRWWSTEWKLSIRLRAAGWNAAYLKKCWISSRQSGPSYGTANISDFKPFQVRTAGRLKQASRFRYRQRGKRWRWLRSVPRLIGKRYGVPFLLENPAYYIADLPTGSRRSEMT